MRRNLYLIIFVEGLIHLKHLHFLFVRFINFSFHHIRQLILLVFFFHRFVTLRENPQIHSAILIRNQFVESVPDCFNRALLQSGHSMIIEIELSGLVHDMCPVLLRGSANIQIFTSLLVDQCSPRLINFLLSRLPALHLLKV